LYDEAAVEQPLNLVGHEQPLVTLADYGCESG
jgi:hypothetical protein